MGHVARRRRWVARLQGRGRYRDRWGWWSGEADPARQDARSWLWVSLQSGLDSLTQCMQWKALVGPGSIAKDPAAHAQFAAGAIRRRSKVRPGSGIDAMNRRMVIMHSDERAHEARTCNGVVTLLIIRPTDVMLGQKLKGF